MLVCAGSALAAADDRQPSAAGKAEPFRKFATDEVLRQGMANIATTVGGPLKEIQAAQLKGPAYIEMAGQIEGQVANIIKNCHLDKRADHALHEIITDLTHAALLMRGPKPEVQRAGALAAIQSLRNYAKYFDHPGWNGPQ